MSAPTTQTGHVTFVHPFDLKQAPDNPRTISDERLVALKYALEADPSMLEARPVIVQSSTREAIGGNQRVRAAQLMIGDDEFPKLNAYVKEHHGIPVFLVELDDARRREWMMRDNNPYGEWERDELAAMVQTHKAEGGDLNLLGFGDDELKDLLERTAPPPPDEPNTAPGLGDVQYKLIIECEDEVQQAQLLEQLQAEGLEVQAVAV